ncbi:MULTISPECIES: copper chaperone PCu(A)C [Rhodococcus]|uniref:Copper chaperone PCu(A)C n=1 Tax=Rhodococcus oxybenzonivorans TaxID=1990687 RepID=A0AAE5A6B1_9NOCA|nr:MULTISPECIES: copper chaperone PCu(A)C [Rhodococcus]MDV7246701.1 copper chaperone PCu(A)C [Rhodococcus oxybenzonivorans]MDV7265013.1 copper chaperone PCu(A)C [Rhodococcus oxybenzonivorans]MDV7278324.1 copper chaperone PCu(A)C [Rhodococcus oxybenzonivorans]MDV7337713.1 copper chaperone PCu(A)C [Rhodococcus oxybenzonivorans]MDV7347921.1 copper chaperone PCu(A)C [Rhodococcus oxybenzonivorans]
MTALDKPTRRVATAVALAAGAALTLSACGAGQITQTSSQVAAVNGNGADLGSIALRNVHVVYPNSDEYSIEAGGKAVLAFTAINNNEDAADKLTKISTDVAKTVTIRDAAGGQEIPPQTALVAGDVAQDAVEGGHAEQERDQAAEVPSDVVLVTLDDLKEGVRPGLTFPVTFTFEKAGEVTVSVPVDAGHETERHVSDKSAGTQAEGGGGH